jgi:hypothetical protein
MPKRKRQHESTKRSDNLHSSTNKKRRMNDDTDGEQQQQQQQQQQQIQQQQLEQEEGLVMAGSLDEILLENFMCHDKLQVQFHSCVTFISGVNGSGKSAILAGKYTIFFI